MAVRQYVGARYVPKFADPVAWQAGTSYEALTIVTYNNSSYTSKVPVPSTVGNPADNDTYWALTGNYNAQVEAYREEAVAVQENLNETNQNLANETQAREQADNNLQKQIDKYYLFIGDSYAVESVTGQNRWPITLANLLKLNSNQYTISAQGSTGFIGITTNTWQTLLENANVPDKEAVTDIIVAGGANDESKSIQNIVTAIENFMNKANELYPNAKVYLANIMYLSAFTGRNHSFSIIDYSYSQITNYGGIYISKTNLCILDTALLQSDGIHPIYNGTANTMIAQAIYNGINGSYQRYLYRTLTFTPVDGVTSDGSISVSEFVNPRGMGWIFSGSSASIPNSFNIAFNETKNIANLTQIGNINTMLPSPGGNLTCSPCAIVPRSPAPTHTAIQGKLVVSRGGVWVELDPQSTSAEFTPAVEVTSINVRPIGPTLITAV